MHSLLLFISFVLLGCCALAIQPIESLIPLSKTANAYQRGNAASNVVVELVIDLTCSSCLDSWPMLNEVVESYSSSVSFMYRVFPLPYHQQAFIVSKAASVVFFYAPSEIFSFIDAAYANQGSIYNSVTSDMSYNEVVNMVGGWVTNSTGVSASQYAVGMDMSTDDGSAVEMNTRYMFKYGGLHHSFATPFYQINGVSVTGLETFEQWKSTLDPLLA
jgi:hypothetical protein